MYARISSDKAGGGLGVDRQLADCRELAARLGWTIVGEYTDNDVSAYSGKPRPGYKALVADLEAGEGAGVLAWHTDRLHRSPTELESFVDLCERRGIVTHTVTAGPLDLSTPSGRMIARQLGVVARYEVEHAVERMQRAKKQAAGKGEWLGGRRPYGWTTSGEVIEDEAAVIRESAELLLTGASLRAVTQAARVRGACTSTGGAWTPTELSRVLRRPRNAGLVRHRGAVLDGVQATWPPILDETTWRAVDHLLGDPARRTNAGAPPRWLGSGLYRCGLCEDGTTVRVTHSTSGGFAGHPAYACRERKHLTRSQSHVDEVVTEVIAARLSQPDAMHMLDVHEDVADFEQQASHARAAQERLEQLGEEFGAGRISLAALQAGTEAARRIVDSHHAAVAARRTDSALATVLSEGDPGAAWRTLVADSRESPASLGLARAVLSALAIVTLLPTTKGRPPGWRPGQPYFRPESVQITWRD